jgi:acylphosphatase
MNKRAHLIITGRVQGVWYRSYTKDKAQKIGLTGWVRNLENGDVEAIIEGEEKAVEEMIEWCYSGSPLSKVEEIQTIYDKFIDEFDEFTILS